MHLHANKIVHRDIAARNVLLAGKKDLLAKVSDFGMARYVDSVYSGISNEQHTAASIGPVKWMAPEQLERMAYVPGGGLVASAVVAPVSRALSLCGSMVRAAFAACWRPTPRATFVVVWIQSSFSPLVVTDCFFKQSLQFATVAHKLGHLHAARIKVPHAQLVRPVFGDQPLQQCCLSFVFCDIVIHQQRNDTATRAHARCEPMQKRG
jgi:hypothetical protein